MIRWIVRALAIVVFAVAALRRPRLRRVPRPVEPDDTASMANTIPACDGRVVAQGFTYRLWSDPSPGDVVAVHAAETDDGEIIPDADADDRTLVLRVAAGPGDVIVGRAGTVFVDEIKFDDIATEPFQPVTVPNEQYFLLGDNRSVRSTAGPSARCSASAIFARVFAVFWPLRDITFRLGQELGRAAGRDRLRHSSAISARLAHETGVAAGHPATAAVGAEILADGGTAADAVVAMALASCVAETVDERPARGLPRDRLRRVARHEPRRLRRGAVGRGRARRAADPVRRRARRLRDRAGVVRRARASRRLSASSGSGSGGLPWTRLCEPALALARAGVPLPEMHARSLEMLGELYALDARRRPLHAGRAHARARATSPPARPRRDARGARRGGRGERVPRLARRGAPARSTASCSPPTTSRAIARSGATRARRVRRSTGRDARRALGCPRAPAPSPPARRSRRRPSVFSPRRGLRALPRAASTRRTWSPSTTTGAHACSRTRSASVPASGSPASTRSSTTSSASPTSRTAIRSPATTSRAAWRRPSCSTGTASSSRSAPRAPPGYVPHSRPVLAAILDEGLDAETAVSLPRVHPTLEVVDAEPGVDEAALTTLEERGAPYAGGPTSTTTSAAWAVSGGPARPAIRAAAAARSSSDEQRRTPATHCCSNARGAVGRRPLSLELWSASSPAIVTSRSAGCLRHRTLRP